MRTLYIIVISVAFFAAVVLSIGFAQDGQYQAASFYTLWAIFMFLVAESTTKENR